MATVANIRMPASQRIRIRRVKGRATLKGNRLQLPLPKLTPRPISMLMELLSLAISFLRVNAIKGISVFTVTLLLKLLLP